MNKFTPITAEQIERFFDHRCTEDEAEQVAKYLKENPEVLKSYVQREWQAAEEQGDMPRQYSDEMFREIQAALGMGKQSYGSQQTGQVRRLSRTLVGIAAAVMLLAAGIWLLYRGEKKPVEKQVSITEIPAAKPAIVQQVRHNSTNKKETILLPDSSTVILYANGTIRYMEPFEADRRSLSVEGEAVFNVTTDKHRPFTVSAGPIVTTVLGTAFSVTEGNDGVEVKLFSGKVSLHGNEDSWKKDIVLTPGEQMSYRKKNDQVVVSRFDEEKVAEEEELPLPVEEQELVFDNESLPKVMDKLAEAYHLSLTYHPKQIGNMYFTGTVLTSDSIETILQVIANMNELKIVPVRKGFIIRK